VAPNADASTLEIIYRKCEVSANCSEGVIGQSPYFFLLRGGKNGFGLQGACNYFDADRRLYVFHGCDGAVDL
jgi:hypothetical protein